MDSGIREFCDEYGYNEREVSDILDSYFRMVRWCISVGSREFKIKRVGGFEYINADVMLKHVKRLRRKIEYEREIDYDELLKYVENAKDRRDVRREKCKSSLKELFAARGLEFDEGIYDGTSGENSFKARGKYRIEEKKRRKNDYKKNRTSLKKGRDENK